MYSPTELFGQEEMAEPCQNQSLDRYAFGRDASAAEANALGADSW